MISNLCNCFQRCQYWSLPEPQCAGVFEGLESLVPGLGLAAHYKVEDLQKVKKLRGTWVSYSSGSDKPGASVSD